MNIFISIFLIIIGFVCLVKGADLFVDNASGIAAKLGIPSVIIGLTIVAFGTSLPELAVSVTAALEGSNEIAVSNVVGSNIFNLLVVAGASACFYPLICDPILLKRDWPLSGFAALLLSIFLFLDQKISRLEGFILLAGLVLILFMQLKSAHDNGIQKEEHRSMGKLWIFLIVGVAFIILGGKITVGGAVSLARIMGLSETLIGLTIVAVGTSLPELVTSVVAAKKGENDIAMGNVIGSNLFNIFCILGVSATLHPIEIALTSLFDTSFLFIVTVIYWLVCRKYQLNRRIGLTMLVLYLLYMVYIVMR